MNINDAGLQIIKHYEGFVARPYLCPAGYLTIGYGHLVRDEDAKKFAKGISEDEAEHLLRVDVSVAENAVARLISQPLTENQFSALVSFTFNLGSGSLQSSTLRRKINRCNFDAAASEFERWIFAGGQRLQGLVLRRETERQLFVA
ncbi:MAG: lysozyme [Pseudomonadota bacterium]